MRVYVYTLNCVLSFHQHLYTYTYVCIGKSACIHKFIIYEGKHNKSSPNPPQMLTERSAVFHC